MTTILHLIDFGESLLWEPPAGTAEFYVWGKLTADHPIMRWKRVAGYNVLTGTRVSVPEASGNISIPGGRIEMTRSDLLLVFDGFDPELFQVTAHDEDMRVISIDVYSIPAPTSTNAASIAAQERRVLKDLLDMRLGLAGMHGGHVKVVTPDGTEVERMPIAVIDRRISEVRARIAIFEQAAEGNDLPRATYW